MTRARAEAVARRIKRYGDSKRGPLILRYRVNDLGALRIDASCGETGSAVELQPNELDGDAGIAKACDAIERVLRRVRDMIAAQ